MSFKTYGRYVIRHLKRHIKRPDGTDLSSSRWNHGRCPYP